MMKEYKRPENITDDEILKSIFIGATECFCNGIYIATTNHECGWDFLQFDDLESWEDLKNLKIGHDGYVLNYGNYDHADENDKLLIDVLNDNDWKFEFEVGSIGW